MAGSGRLIDYLGEGAAADRPTSLTLFSGALGLYYATDTGTLSVWDGAAWDDLSGSGTVTSVDLAMPTGFTVADNPVTTSGTLTVSEDTQAANKVKAGPATGADAAPTYRSLVAADLPDTAVTAGDYGDATHVGTFTVDAQGRITAAGSVAITGSGGATAFTDLSDVPTSYTGKGSYYVQVKSTEDGLQFTAGTGTAVAWGSVTGILSDQTDLQTALDAKADAPTTNNTVFGDTAFSSGTSSYNVAIGFQAGRTLTGDGNTAIGVSALGDATCAGTNNTAIGRGALSENSNGGGNVAIGWNALTTNTVSDNNVAVGTNAFEVNLGGSGTAIGAGALASNSLSSYNCAVGQNALTNATGEKNTGLGTQCGPTITSGAQNIVIGYLADVPSATANGQMSIGNIIYGFGNIGTGTTLSTGRVTIGTKTDDGTHRLQVSGGLLTDTLALPGTTSEYVRGDGSRATLTALTNPMTTAQDLIIGGSSGTPTRLPIIPDGKLLGAVAGAWAAVTASGTGDMTAAVYDAAGIAQQVVGTTAAQTLTNKDLSDSSNSFPATLAKDRSTVSALTNSSGTVNVDLSLGDYFTLLGIAANVTSLTFSNLPPSGHAYTIDITVSQDATGSRTFALPSSFKAIGSSDTAIQSAASAKTKIIATTIDGGTTWAYSMAKVAA